MRFGLRGGHFVRLMAYREPALAVDGVELLPDWADTARDNVRLNCLDSRVRIVTGDLRRHREFLEAGAYDLVVANPPYIPPAAESFPKTQTAQPPGRSRRVPSVTCAPRHGT
jgi:tRNA1(Val) A37 N6-methylase TrmN6